MFGHRSFLMIGGGAADIKSLISGGYEIAKCNFTFQQGLDDKGHVSTRVYSGTIHVVLPQLPPKDILEWAVQSRKYHDGMIVLVDNENIPLEKIFFKNAACIGIEVEYTYQGSSYSTTSIVIQAENMVVGNGITFQSEWIL